MHALPRMLRAPHALLPPRRRRQVSGEDLTPYRAASKAIAAVLQRFGPAERLGMDEVFVDATQVGPIPYMSHAGT
jgi:nucleotidyltransferase/DNA polymerase involved in DNA repair